MGNSARAAVLKQKIAIKKGFTNQRVALHAATPPLSNATASPTVSRLLSYAKSFLSLRYDRPLPRIIDVVAPKPVRNRALPVPKVTRIVEHKRFSKAYLIGVGLAARLREQSRRRQSQRLAFRQRVRTIGSIHDVRSKLGFYSNQSAKDVVLVSIDTEWEEHSHGRRVAEVGISALNTAELKRIRPGPYGNDWLDACQHSHYVVHASPSSKRRVQESLFGKSRIVQASRMRESIIEQFQALGLLDGTKEVVLVGHSIDGDYMSLREDMNIRLDLLNSGLNISMALDTHDLATAAFRAGAKLTGYSLGDVAREAGIDPQYLRYKGLKAAHNASNDAAYSLITLLLMATKWDMIKARTSAYVLAQPKRKQTRKDDTEILPTDAEAAQNSSYTPEATDGSHLATVIA